MLLKKILQLVELGIREVGNMDVELNIEVPLFG